MRRMAINIINRLTHYLPWLASQQFQTPSFRQCDNAIPVYRKKYQRGAIDNSTQALFSLSQHVVCPLALCYIPNHCLHRRATLISEGHTSDFNIDDFAIKLDEFLFSQFCRNALPLDLFNTLSHHLSIIGMDNIQDWLANQLLR